MVSSGNGDRGGLDIFLFEQLVEVGGGSHPKFISHGLGTSGVRIGDSSQANRLSLLLELAIDARMVASEDAGANDGNVDDLGLQS